MSKCSSELFQEKRKLLYWLSSWTGNEECAQNVNLDIPDLSVILQIMGWTLEAMDKVAEGENQNYLKIQLVCQASGTRSTFTKHSPNCKCPTNEDINQMQVWTVTGCGPKTISQNSINSSTHSLIPTVSLGKVELISRLLDKIFTISNDKESVQKEPVNNLSQNTALTRNRSLDTLRDNSNPFKETLKREASLEIDPPMQTSSPVPNITQTLSRISLDSDLGREYAKDLEEIKKLVDEKFEKIKKGSKNATRKRVSNIQPTGSNALHQMPSTPRKTMTPKRRLAGSGKPASQIPSSLRKNIVPTTSTNLIKSSTNSFKKSVLLGKSNDVVFKSKIGTTSKIKAKIGLSASTPKLNQPSVSGFQKYTKNCNF